MIFEKAILTHSSTETIQSTGICPGLPKENLHHFTAILLLILITGLQLPSFAQQQNIDSFLEVLKTEKADTNKVKLLYKLSDILTDKKPDKAIEYANQGLAIAQKIDFKKGQSICLNALGRAYYQIGKLDTAFVCFEKCYKIVSEIKDSMGIAGVYDNLAIIYIRFGKNDKALELRKKANDIYSDLNEKSSLASGYDWIGNIYRGQGEYSIALEYSLKALKIYEAENDEQGIGYALLNISSIYRYLKQYEKAKQYAFEAKTIFIKVENPEGIGAAWYRLALIFTEEKDYEKTIDCLLAAKKIFEETQNTYLQTLVNLMLGTSYHDQGDNDKALSYFNNAIPIALQMGDKNVISVLYQNIATASYDKGDFLKALEYMRKSEKILNEINDKKSLREISVNFIELYSRINQPDSVVKYLNLYQQLSDSLFGEQNSKSIAEMQTKYETEKKDKEIISLKLEDEKKKNNIWALLIAVVVFGLISLLSLLNFRNRKKKEQAILNQYSAELSLQVSESEMKALRSQMNPHFIFNCVHTVDRLLDDLKISESKIYLEKFSSLTRTVLENSKKKEIPLSEEMESLRLYMDLENMRFRNPFKYEFTIKSHIDPAITLIPPLILQPFVENSIKHGFCDTGRSGHIKIEICNENDFLICTVEDNGVGRINGNNIKPLSGFKKESLGIKLTEERLELIRKRKRTETHFVIDDLVDDNNNPAGTYVKLFLPYELSV